MDNEEARRVARILKKNGRRIHLVLDTDSRQRGKKFTDDGLEKAGLDPARDVTFIGKTEFEDAFGDDVWLDVLNEDFPRTARIPWTQKDLDDAHESGKFSYYMVNAVGLCSDHISKPELGRCLAAKAVATGRVPAALHDLMQVVHRKAAEV